LVEPETHSPAHRRWTWWRLLGYSAIAAATYIGSQFLAVVCVVIAMLLSHPGSDVQAWAPNIESNGFVLSVAICASALGTVPLLRLLAGQVDERPWSFLGFRPVSVRTMLLSCGAMVIFIVAGDIVGMLLRRPVPPFMIAAYDTARFPVLLAVALVVAAPFLEELLFRGFLFGGLRACGAPVAVAVVVVSVVFGAIHTQYDPYDITYVFLMGVLFAGARVRFDSIVPSIAMHSLSNAVALAEVAWSRMHAA